MDEVFDKDLRVYSEDTDYAKQFLTENVKSKLTSLFDYTLTQSVSFSRTKVLCRRILLEGKRIAVSHNVSDQLLVNVDKDMMVRVLVNLLTNAIKYSGCKSIIDFKANSSESGCRSVCLAVKDHGKGISSEDLPKIFNKYWACQNQSNGHFASTGIGLTFCKLAVEAHSGQLIAESEIGVGSTFTICLPDTLNVPQSHEIEVQKLIWEVDEPALSEPEVKVVNAIFLAHGETHVFQVSKLNLIIRELEEHDINPVWLGNLRNTIRNLDEVAFNEMTHN